MNEFIYWYAPLWQVVIALASGILLFLALLGLARQRPDVSAALTAVDPVLDRQPALYFDRAQGIMALNEGGKALLQELREANADKLHALADVMLEAQAETRVVQEETILPGQTIVAVPILQQPDLARGVLALLAPQAAPPPPAQPEIIAPVAPSPNHRDWQPLGKELVIHTKRALVQVKRPSAQADEAASGWQEYVLSVTEHQLLRYLLEYSDMPQTSETLFHLLWPQDEVDQFGLRPDQGDRLRRVVFTLRQKIEPNARTPRYLCTVHGMGYVMHAQYQGENL